jgi:TonB-linked SusC/RagA family outer membrane protein
MLSIRAVAQNPETVTVSGFVTSADTDEPIVAVMVSAGTSSSVLTGVDGSYTIAATVGTQLSYQFFGYEDQAFIVPEGATAVNHNVELVSDVQLLDDVVVVAYGVRKKGTIAGSVTTVKSDKIENTPTASFDQALQGQTPGLTVISNSGEPSDPASFAIRGTNSINSGTSPLFILDGLPIASADFAAISPADIESITVLKDASATSIYGARAANGVLVITTKRGALADKAKISYRMQLGFSQLAHGNWSQMNTAERIQYEKETNQTAGKDYDLLSKTDVNWRDAVFTDFAPLQNHELQVSGATEKVNYFVSGGWYNQDGLTSDSDFQRYNFRTNFEVRTTDWLKVGTNTMFAYETFHRSVAGEDYYMNTPVSASRFMLPYYDPYKADGELASIGDGSWKGTGENPLEWVEYNPADNQKYKVISSLFLEATPIEGLTLRSQGGVDYSFAAASSESLPSYAVNNGAGFATKGMSKTRNLTITNTANYRFDIDHDHNFNFMLGQEGVDYYGDSFSVRTTGQTNDKLTTLSNGTRADSWGNSSANYALISAFGRGEYNYKNRYFVEVSGRGDWSSRFGKNNRGAAFWSVGLMWTAKGEEFLRDVDWLTNAQVSFNTGTSGNQEIPMFDHLPLVAGGPEYNGSAGIAPSSKGNPDLSWEELWSTNLAFKFGFWNRANLEIDLYNKLTTKMLMSVPVSFAVDASGNRWDNVGGMVNRGVEVNLNADVVRAGDFSWNVNANISYNHNELTELYNGITEYVNGSTKLVVDHSIGEFFVNRYAGVNPANGDALWYDKDGELTTEFRESDKVMVGKSYLAPWQGGFGTTLSWKGLMLSAQFSWVADRWMMNNDRFFEENGLFAQYNQSKRMLYDRWKKPGDVTDIPRHGVAPQSDSRLLEDASFLRLKNLMLAYNLPGGLLKKTGFMAGARVYVQAQNLLTFTKFTGLDPEFSGAIYKVQYPMSKQYSFGLELTF